MNLYNDIRSSTDIKNFLQNRKVWPGTPAGPSKLKRHMISFPYLCIATSMCRTETSRAKKVPRHTSGQNIKQYQISTTTKLHQN